MLYRTMPKIDEKLSVLGFGCMRLPVNPNYTINEPRAIKQIRYAADHGVNILIGLALPCGKVNLYLVKHLRMDIEEK